jgi:hypothetical protein
MTTDKRFIAACKKAAELRSDLFKHSPSIGGEESWLRLRDDHSTLFCTDHPTQDDIDAMAAAVGWEYEVQGTKLDPMTWESKHEKPTRWYSQIWQTTIYDTEWAGKTYYPDKLTAAKEAFCAIVEQLEKQ